MYDEPNYLSASPTVMSYDYSTGDYFAPAYLGQQTPAQANAAAVAAVGPTGMEIAQPAPLVGHPTPQYPQVGHEPQFTMPMNKGEWNIRGVNIPSYSPALPPMPGSDWATFPQPIDGSQLDFSRPQFSAYAGPSYGAAAPLAAFGKSRDVQGTGGYRYRQFNDGSIQILISGDARALPPGTILRDDASQAAAYRRWAAITAEIGAWKDYVNARTAQLLAVTTDTALKIAASAPRRKRRAAAAAADAPPVVVENVEETPSIFAGPLPWIVGGAVVVLGVVLFASSRPGKSKQ